MWVACDTVELVIKVHISTLTEPPGVIVYWARPFLTSPEEGGVRMLQEEGLAQVIPEVKLITVKAILTWAPTGTMK